MTRGAAVLDRDMYSEAEAARLLGVSQGTLHYWLEGGERRGVVYRPVIAFVERVTWRDGIARGWRPHADPASPVRIDPDVRFGRPAVSGVSTEAIWEQREAGDDTDEIADMFDLSKADVEWAIAHELSTRAA